MPIQVQLADGRIVEYGDEYSREQIQADLDKFYPVTKPASTQGIATEAKPEESEVQSGEALPGYETPEPLTWADRWQRFKESLGGGPITLPAIPKAAGPYLGQVLLGPAKDIVPPSIKKEYVDPLAYTMAQAGKGLAEYTLTPEGAIATAASVAQPELAPFIWGGIGLSQVPELPEREAQYAAQTISKDPYERMQGWVGAITDPLLTGLMTSGAPIAARRKFAIEPPKPTIPIERKLPVPEVPEAVSKPTTLGDVTKSLEDAGIKVNRSKEYEIQGKKYWQLDVESPPTKLGPTGNEANILLAEGTPVEAVKAEIAKRFKEFEAVPEAAKAEEVKPAEPVPAPAPEKPAEVKAAFDEANRVLNLSTEEFGKIKGQTAISEKIGSAMKSKDDIAELIRMRINAQEKYNNLSIQLKQEMNQARAKGNMDEWGRIADIASREATRPGIITEAIEWGRGQENKIETFKQKDRNYKPAVPMTDAEFAQLEAKVKSEMAKPEVGPGMGAAKLEEMQRPIGPTEKPQESTGIKQEAINQARIERERESLPAPEKQKQEAALHRVKRDIDENPQHLDELEQEIINNPDKVLTSDEVLAADIRYVELQGEYRKAMRDADLAISDNRDLDLAEANHRMEYWDNRLNEFEVAARRAGSAWGRTGAMMQRRMRADFSLEAMQTRARRKLDRPLTAEESSQISELNKHIEELERRNEQLQGRTIIKEGEASIEQTKKEVASDQAETAKRKASGAKTDTRTVEERQSELVKALEESAKEGGVTPEEFSKYVKEIVKTIVEKDPTQKFQSIFAKAHELIKTAFPDVDRMDIIKAHNDYGKAKPASTDPVKVRLAQLRGEGQKIAGLQTVAKQLTPPLATGPRRPPPSDLTRRLTKKIHEKMKELGITIKDPARQLADGLKSRKTYLMNRIKDLRYEIAKKRKIVQNKSVPMTDAEIEMLRREYDQLKVEHEEIFGKRELTPEQKIQKATLAAERQLADWQNRLELAQNRIFVERGKPIPIQEVEAIKARVDAIKEQVKTLKDLAYPKRVGTAEEIALQNALTRTKNLIASYHDRMAKGEFGPRERKPQPESKELQLLQNQLAETKRRFGTLTDQWKFNELNLFQKTGQRGLELWRALRTLMTTGEFSFVLRQGKMLGFPHPIIAARTIPKLLKSFASQAATRKFHRDIIEDPLYPASQKAKLHISEIEDALSKQEEFAMGRWATQIPVVKNFNRAATTFLNQLRFDSWKAMRKTMSRFGSPTPKEDAMYARFANEATGRGGLGKAESAGVLLGDILFSPRYLASRIQMAAGHSMWGGTARSRAVIAGEYAKILAGYAIYYTMLYFGLNALRQARGKDKIEIETDIRSSDFLKLKMDNTRLDLLTGLGQLATFGGRTVTGETKTLGGKIYPLTGKVPYGRPRWSDIAYRFGRSKLHPGPAGVINLLDGVDLVGNETSMQTEAGKLIGPITYIDIWKAFQEQGWDEASIVSMLAFLGEGLQTYNPQRRKSR